MIYVLIFSRVHVNLQIVLSLAGLFSPLFLFEYLEKLGTLQTTEDESLVYLIADQSVHFFNLSIDSFSFFIYLFFYL